MTVELGIIEGYYGAPWSWAERAAQVDFLAPHGYGFFTYAPKADPFLRRHQLAMLDLMRSGGLSKVSPDLENATGEPGRSVADWLARELAQPVTTGKTE